VSGARNWLNELTPVPVACMYVLQVPPGIVLNLAFAKSGIATAGNW
jgi:hypothetical protein